MPIVVPDSVKRATATIARVGAFISPFAIVLAVAFTGYFWVDSRYVHKSPDFSALQQRLEIKIQSDYVQQANARIWTLQDRLASTPTDKTAVEELRHLIEEKKTLEAELVSLKASSKP